MAKFLSAFLNAKDCSRIWGARRVNPAFSPLLPLSISLLRAVAYASGKSSFLNPLDQTYKKYYVFVVAALATNLFPQNGLHSFEKIHPYDLVSLLKREP